MQDYQHLKHDESDTLKKSYTKDAWADPVQYAP